MLILTTVHLFITLDQFYLFLFYFYFVYINACNLVSIALVCGSRRLI